MRQTTLFIIIFLFNGTHSICCECFHKGKITVQDYNSYDWIFIGRLINETKSGGDKCTRIALYKVIKVYKGFTIEDTVRVCDAENSGACGLQHLTVGRDYLIYANGVEKKWTSDCTRTTRVPIQFWPQDSVSINKLKNLRSFGRIYDTTHTNFHADTLFLNKHVLKIRKNSVQKFYDEYGRILAVGRYINGVPEGFWNYFENNKVVSKGKYIKGKKDSLWVEPFMDESVYINEYKAGEFTYRQKFFFDGKLSSSQEPTGDGKKWIKYDYHSNGQARYIEYANPPERDSNNILREPVSNGPFKMFNRAGIVLQKGNNKNGTETGTWQYYYENGKLRMEGNYIQLRKEDDFLRGYKNGVWKIYYPNGRIKAAGEYENSEKVGMWKYYNEKGKEISPDPKLIEEDEDWFTYSGVKN